MGVHADAEGGYSDRPNLLSGDVVLAATGLCG